MLQALANTASIAAVLIPSSVAMMLAGAIPRAGPGRALALAARSLVHRADIQVASLRVDATRTLLDMLSSIGKNQYIVVTGRKGVGKSVVVDTATQRTCGVVSLSVAPGMSQAVIVANALSRVANSRIGFVDLLPSVRRVLWWYGWFLSRPIVVLRAGERMEGEAYAQIPGAARELTSYGLRVLIDGSSNSLPSEVFATKRQVVLELEPMLQNTLRSIPEYADLFKILRKECLEEVAWLVLGGVPTDYDELLLLMARNEPATYRRVIVDYILDEVGKAIDRRDTMLAAHPAMKTVLDIFKSQSRVPKALLTEMGIVNPSPNKALRAKMYNHVFVLVPADAAMALVLRLCLTTPPSIDDLQKLAIDTGGGDCASSPESY